MITQKANNTADNKANFFIFIYFKLLMEKQIYTNLAKYKIKVLKN